MKRVNYLLVVIAALSFMAACKNVNYKKTKSGLLYKVFPGKGKDSIKAGSIVKFNYVIKFNDSVMYDSHGKMPGFVRVVALDRPTYDFQEIITMMRKGDSAITVQMADSVMKQPNQQLLPANAKKGDRLTFSFRITDVFPNDSLAKKDFDAEAERDRPRQMKEQEEQMAKAQKEQEAQQLKEIEEMEKSGEAAKELKEIESWLAAKNINAQRTGKGTFVVIHEQGTGPAAELGKYVNVKYAGKDLVTDSLFQANTYAFKLGTTVILGWTEGLQLFKQGGKGTLYIPGFLAYGSNPGPTNKPFAALKFDIELLEVSDNPIEQQQMPTQQGQ
ncbi:MAG: FKBP-type peptidyl-prolyl cis-trans isomerase [Chitinophagales bacterium]